MMKRSIALIIISFTLLLVISGCGTKSTVISNNDIYSIKEIDNDYYMVIDRSKANELSGTSQLASLSFDSMDHIIDALANGKFQDPRGRKNLGDAKGTERNRTEPQLLQAFFAL